MRGETEDWRAVVGHEARYQVSDKGRIRLKRARVEIEATVNPAGWRVVRLRFGDPAEEKCVARMVAEAFHGSPKGLSIVHLDGNPANNRIDNLRWKVTPAWKRT